MKKNIIQSNFHWKKNRFKYFIQLMIFPITLLAKKKTIWRKVFPHFPDGHLLREIIFIWIRGSC